MRVTLIAALASNRVIGKDNQLPWRIPGDLPRFKRLTTGQTLVMGRKTFDAIGRPLPGRQTIVVTRNHAFAADGVEVAHSLEAALAKVETDEAFVAGGGELYAQALPLADRLLLTEIDAPFEGDAFFPDFDRSAWQVAEEERQDPSETFPHRVHYRTYVPVTDAGER
jgi:dihydrofolate reductase